MHYFVEVAGWLAAASILGAYCLLSLGKLQAKSTLYQGLNIVGAFGFILNCWWNGAWPSVALNVAWLVIGFLALRRNRSTAHA
jgi:hypothetical protein